MKRQVKAKLRRLFGMILSLLFRRRKTAPVFSGPLRSVCILAQEKWGDAILLSPLIGALRTARPDCAICVVTAGVSEQFFNHDPNVAECISLKKNRAAAISRLRRMRFDVLFNTKDHPSTTYLLASVMARARYKVGIYHWSQEGIYDHILDVGFHTHIVDKNCALLPWLGIQVRAGSGKSYLPVMTVSTAIRTIAPTIAGHGAIGINLSAGEPAREWDAGRWEELVRALNSPFVVFAMRDRMDDKTRLEKMPGAIPTPPTENLTEAGTIIKTLRLLVSPDTALVHVAACTDTPVVGLYRNDPIHRSRFAPYGAASRMVASPSSRIQDISVADVVAAVNELIAAEHR
jgi:heptosyltransferase III